MNGPYKQSIELINREGVSCSLYSFLHLLVSYLKKYSFCLIVIYCLLPPIAIENVRYSSLKTITYLSAATLEAELFRAFGELQDHVIALCINHQHKILTV